MVIILSYLFVFGLMFGSFLNVFIYRWPREEQWVKGRSRCLSCNNNLSWYDLVPLFSFIFLRGKCRYCGVKLSWQYPLVELANAIGWLWIGGMAINGMNLVGIGKLSFYPFCSLFMDLNGNCLADWGFVKVIMLMFLWSLSLAAMVIDIKHLLLPDELTISLVIMGIVLILIGSPLPLVDRLLAGLAAMGSFYVLHWSTKGMGMGLGDVKLVGGLGILLGWYSGWVVAVSFFIGSFVGIFMMILGKARFGVQIAFGPFLITGLWIVLVWGDVIRNGYRALMGV